MERRPSYKPSQQKDSNPNEVSTRSDSTKLKIDWVASITPSTSKLDWDANTRYSTKSNQLSQGKRRLDPTRSED
ncbi:hypothetical protein C5H23_09935 [Xylella fastidiosa]|nr:hypothetical protein C5H23_09935 [Xylella fastidiosa]TNV97879.1 hypothetical protein C5H21_11010 [Xylella fastidiosa]